MSVINFEAARARVLKLAAQRNFYVEFEFTNAELIAAANRRTIADLLREGVAVLGYQATVQEIEL